MRNVHLCAAGFAQKLAREELRQQHVAGTAEILIPVALCMVGCRIVQPRAATATDCLLIQLGAAGSEAYFGEAEKD